MTKDFLKPAVECDCDCPLSRPKFFRRNVSPFVPYSSQRRHPHTGADYDGDNPLRLAEEIDAALDKYGLGNKHHLFTSIKFFEGELRLIADCLRCAGSHPSQVAAIAARLGQNIGLIIAAAVVLLMLGAFLSFKGYSRERK